MKENPKEYLSLDMKNLIDSCITKIEEFRMEAFIDYLKEKCTELKDIDFSIYNHESIILAILSYKYNTYTAQLLSYLLNRIPNSDLDMLIRSLKNSDTFYYFNDEQIKRYNREKSKYDGNDFQHYIESGNLDDDLSEVISEGKRIQNIFYWTHNGDERDDIEFETLLNYYFGEESKVVLELGNMITYSIDNSTFYLTGNKGKKYLTEKNPNYKKIMDLLIKNKGRSVSYSEICNYLWGKDYYTDIKNLTRKINTTVDNLHNNVFYNLEIKDKNKQKSNKFIKKGKSLEIITKIH